MIFKLLATWVGYASAQFGEAEVFFPSRETERVGVAHLLWNTDDIFTTFDRPLTIPNAVYVAEIPKTRTTSCHLPHHAP